jgi:hypothetical protein
MSRDWLAQLKRILKEHKRATDAYLLKDLREVLRLFECSLALD